MADNDQSQASETEQGKGGGEGGFAEAFAERGKDPAGHRTEETAEAAAAPAAAEGGEGSAPADQSQAASPEAADEGSGTKAPAFDPYAGLTPEQKSFFEAEAAEKVKLAASERSQRGRVGALTKKLNGLQGTQAPPAAGTEGSQARSDEGADGTGTGTGTAQSATDIEARLKATTEEYGDVLGPLPELVTELRKEVDGLKASATRHEVDQDAEALAKAYGVLEEKHPDYQAVAADPKFHDWLGRQTPGIQALAGSFDPNETSLALTLFKTESAAALQATEEREQGGDGGTATGDKRERQLDGMRQVPNRGAPAAAGVPTDFKSAFKQRAQKA